MSVYQIILQFITVFQFSHIFVDSIFFNDFCYFHPWGHFLKGWMMILCCEKWMINNMGKIIKHNIHKCRLFTINQITWRYITNFLFYNYLHSTFKFTLIFITLEFHHWICYFHPSYFRSVQCHGLVFPWVISFCYFEGFLCSPFAFLVITLMCFTWVSLTFPSLYACSPLLLPVSYVSSYALTLACFLVISLFSECDFITIAPSVRYCNWACLYVCLIVCMSVQACNS